MRAKSLALCLVLFVVTLSVQAINNQNIPLGKSTQVVKSKIDLNKVGLSELTGSFRGVGKKRAQAIIAYRESHHGFKSIEELASIKGFGQHFLEVNREKLKEIFIVN